MYDLVSIGESMLRLTPPKFERLRRMSSLDVHMCGSQQNIAANVARLGLKTAFLTKLPDSELGHYALDFCMSCGVDASHIKLVDDARMGLNFIEFGCTPRNSKAIYDRKGSAASTMMPSDFDFESILCNTRIAYTDGIMPGLSQNCLKTIMAYLQCAKAAGCKIAFDINYREHLWSVEVAKKVYEEILELVDILIVGKWHSKIIFGIEGTEEEVIKQFADKYSCSIVAMTLRNDVSVTNCDWNSLVCHEGAIIKGEPYTIDVVDRFGGGDAWCGGFLAALLREETVEEAVNLGNAACALHNTTPGDVAHFTYEEVKLFSKSSGYIIRR